MKRENPAVQVEQRHSADGDQALDAVLDLLAEAFADLLVTQARDEVARELGGDEHHFDHDPAGSPAHPHLDTFLALPVETERSDG